MCHIYLYSVGNADDMMENSWDEKQRKQVYFVVKFIIVYTHALGRDKNIYIYIPTTTA